MFQALPRKPAVLLLAATVFASGAAFADDVVPTLAAGSGLALRLMQAPPQLKERAKPVTRAPNKRDEFEKSYDLFIRYTEGTIYNPTTAKFDKVKLRAYQQTSDSSWDDRDPNAASFMAPTVVMAAGQTVRFRLHNQLPQLSAAQCASTDMNAPNPSGCFNVTNLHSHGLWVSPSGNSDNVLISIKPGVNFEYEYNIPVGHPAGTFWYHPHQHGSTAMQVASGMAGALVVEGDSYPTAKANGDLDVLLKKFQPAKGSAAEVMLLQQIPYGCLDKDRSKTVPCADGEVGVMESFEQVEAPTAWRDSGRYTSVNGKVQPLLDMQTQQLYRWRLIDTGFQASVALRIRRAKDAQKLFAAISAPDQKLDIMDLCDGDDITQFEVASDGLTHEKIISKTLNYLQPGYRSDILFSLPQAGAYCVYDDTRTNNLSLTDYSKKTRLIGVIRAAANPKPPGHAKPNGSAVDFLRAELYSALKGIPSSRMPEDVKSVVLEDLKSGLKLSKFVPHPSFTKADEIRLRNSPKEYVTFNIATLGNATRFMVEGDPAKNKEPDIKNVYQADRVDHTVILNTDQMWELGSKLGSHPFHIHVNPFQIISIVSTKASRKSDDDIDPQYKDLIGTWKDTLLVIKDHKIEVATRYERYIGEYVLHCHILEHEDQGMMQNVKVVLPDGQGGADAGGHHH
jgi:FtsP/CotA-like multicopper oxidase with cupredoxin domain